MSITVSLLTDPSSHVAALHHGGQIMAAGGNGGVLDWLNTKATTATTTLKTVGTVVVLALVILGVWKSGGALAGVLMTLVVGVIAMYAILNTTGASPLQDKVKKELSTTGAPAGGPITHLPELKRAVPPGHQVA